MLAQARTRTRMHTHAHRLAINTLADSRTRSAPQSSSPYGHPLSERCPSDCFAPTRCPTAEQHIIQEQNAQHPRPSKHTHPPDISYEIRAHDIPAPPSTPTRQIPPIHPDTIRTHRATAARPHLQRHAELITLLPTPSSRPAAPDDGARRRFGALQLARNASPTRGTAR